MSGVDLITPNKDLRALIELARMQGWLVERTGGDHIKWTPADPDQEFYISSSTPSSQRTIQKIKSALKSRGLIMDKREFGRMTRAVRDSLADHNRKLTDLKAAFLKSGLGPEDCNLDDMSPESIDTLHLIIDEKGRLDLKCVCDTTFLAPLGFFRHIAKCPTFLAALDPDPTNEETMDRHPGEIPERERLGCPECPAIFWITEPGRRAKHVLIEHGKEQCPYCHGWYTKARGGLTRHMRACNAQPRTNDVLDRHKSEVEPEPQARRPEPSAPEPQIAEIDMTQIVAESARILSEADELATAVIRDAEEAAERILSEAQRAKKESAPSPPSKLPQTTLNTPSTKGESKETPSDDDLWQLLEIVLDGPVKLDRATFALVGQWMDVTRQLFGLKS
jgi:hypothetical protein